MEREEEEEVGSTLSFDLDGGGSKKVFFSPQGQVNVICTSAS